MHWCWWTTSGGNKPGLKQLSALKIEHPEAAAEAVATIERHLQGKVIRNGGITHLRDQIYEVRARDGRIWLRIFFFKDPPHQIGVMAHKKKDKKADSSDIELAKSRRGAWSPSDCSGDFDFESWI